MKLFVLGAGLGARLGSLCLNVPKPLLRLGRRFTLIDWQVKVATEIWGIKSRDVFFVGGHRSGIARQYCESLGVNFVYNPNYREYNNIYSFKLISLYYGGEDFLVLNGDTVLSWRSSLVIWEKLVGEIKRRSDAFFVVVHEKELDEEDMKVLLKENGAVKEFGKRIPVDLAKGEFIGLTFVRSSTAKEMFRIFDEEIKRGHTSWWYEQGFNACIDSGLVCWPILFENLYWTEVDSPDDLEVARGIVAEEA